MIKRNLTNCKKTLAFTLAEVLIVLGIVGIVAQMVLPSIVKVVQESQYKIGKDKVRMSVAEAGKIMSVSDTIAIASSAEDFVKNQLSTYLKITKFCAPADMEQCGMPSGNPTPFLNLYDNFVTSMPTTWSTITSPYGMVGASANATNPTSSGAFNNSYVFLMPGGIAVNLFYNPYCAVNNMEKSADGVTEYYQYSLDTACMSGVYDMNGLAKPNQVGKDIGFFGVFFNGLQSNAVSVLPYDQQASNQNWSNAINYCKNIKGYKLPSIDELSALYLGGRNITGIPTTGWLRSSSSYLNASGQGRTVRPDRGVRGWYPTNSQGTAMCVRE